MKPLAIVLCGIALAATACSSKKAATTTTAPAVLPQAQTPDIWARRIVDRLLRPLNQDLTVVNGFDNAQIRLYIETGNSTTLQTIEQRMNDLARCTLKLAVIGPPPSGKDALRRINDSLHTACAAYVQVAHKLSQATALLSSGHSDAISRGNDLARSARAPSLHASQHLVAAIRLAQNQPEFRRAGLRPSV